MPAIAKPGGANGLPNPVICLYGNAIRSAQGLVDLWPCDDPSGSTTLRNLITPSRTLGSFGANVKTGLKSLLGNDPYGKSYWGGHAKTASNYTLPTAAGSVELLFAGASMGAYGNTSFGSNWDGTSGLLIYGTGTGGTIRIYRGTNNVNAATPPPFSMGSTVHLAVTWDSTTQYLYLNGVVAAQQSVGAMSNAARALEFGNYNSSGGTEMAGGFQWIAVYNRALSAAEVKMHYGLVIQPG